MKTYLLVLSITLASLVVKAKTPFPTLCTAANVPLRCLTVLCDACGCSGNGGSMGFGTGLNNNFVGVRYMRQLYRSKNGTFNNSPWIDEHFNTLQLWSQIPLGQKIIFNAVLPYNFHTRTSSNDTEHIRGLGDATILVYYQALKQAPDSIVTITPQHTLQLGGGIKAPTGKFDVENLKGSVNPGFQLGTGSWDVLIAANYGVTYRNWGLLFMANYTFKSENSKAYRFGNQLNYALNTYKTYYIGTTIALTPQLGIGGEYFDPNTSFGFTVKNTGGYALLGKVGVETKYKKYALGISLMPPLAQELNKGKVEIKNRFSVYVNFNI